MPDSDIQRRAQAAATTFGSSVRSAREALGLSQMACARSMSVSKNCLHNLERGTDARMSTAVAALAMLGASMQAMRLAVGVSETTLASHAGLQVPIVRAIEAGLSFDMPALLQAAAVFKGLAATASIANLRRSTAA